MDFGSVRRDNLDNPLPGTTRFSLPGCREKQGVAATDDVEHAASVVQNFCRFNTGSSCCDRTGNFRADGIQMLYPVAHPANLPFGIRLKANIGGPSQSAGIAVLLSSIDDRFRLVSASRGDMQRGRFCTSTRTSVSQIFPQAFAQSPNSTGAEGLPLSRWTAWADAWASGAGRGSLSTRPSKFAHRGSSWDLLLDSADL